MSYPLKYISDINGKGLELKDSELMLLLFIYELRVVKQKQLFDFVQLFPDNSSTNYRAFCVRMKKFEKEGLIKRRRYNLLSGKTIYNQLVEIEKKGLSLLYLAGILTDFTKRNPINQNMEHFLGITQSVLEMFKVFSKTDGAVIGVNSVSGSSLAHPYVFNPVPQLRKLKTPPDQLLRNKNYQVYAKDITANVRKKDIAIRDWELKDVLLAQRNGLLNSFNFIKTYFIERGLHEDFIKKLWPDWIFLNENRTYFIEVDNNNEREPILLLKLDKYIELSQKDPDHHYTLFFIMLDNSLNLKMLDDDEAITKKIRLLKYSFFVNPFLFANTIDRNGDIDKKVVNGSSRSDKNNTERAINSKAIKMGTPIEGISLRAMPKNLDVFVLPLERANSVFNRAVHAHVDEVTTARYSKHSPATTVRKKMFDQMKLNNIPIKAIPPHIIQSNSLFSASNEDKIDYKKPSIAYEISNILTLFPFVLREGDVRAMDEACYWAGKILKPAPGVVHGAKTDKVVAIYEFEDEMLNDIKTKEFLDLSTEGAIVVYCIETQKLYNEGII